MSPTRLDRPRVLNRRRDGMPEGAVYVGRPRGGGTRHYGNPFTNRPGTAAAIVLADREACIAAFRDWLRGDAWSEVEPERRRWILEHLEELRGRHLVCWCAPASCHAEVLLELANDAEDDA